jgi:hypothetical protein
MEVAAAIIPPLSLYLSSSLPEPLSLVSYLLWAFPFEPQWSPPPLSLSHPLSLSLSNFIPGDGAETML